MNAVAMIRRCGEHQRGQGAAPLVFQATTSRESTYTRPDNPYVCEEVMGDTSRPLPPQDTAEWA